MLWTPRKTRSYSVWITFGLGLALSTILIVVALTESLARNKDWSAITGPGVYPGPVIDTLINLTQNSTLPTYILSLIIAASAAVLTVNRVNCRDYMLIMLTNVPDWKLLRAHVLQTLHRWRLPLVFLLGIVPLQIVLGLLPDIYWCGIINEGVCWSARSPTLNGLFALVKLSGMWLIIILAIFVGVWLGLWWRNTLHAVIGTTGMLLPILGIMFGIQHWDLLGYPLYRLAGTITVNIIGMKTNPFFDNISWTILTYTCVPLVLIVPVLYLARRNVRKLA